MTIGSTTTLSTFTSWTFSLPVTATATAVGSVWAMDSGTSYYVGASLIDNGSTSVQALQHGGGSAYGYNVPFTWTTNDRLIISATYEC